MLHIFCFVRKIITATTLKIFLMGRSGCPTKQENWGGGSPCKPISLNFPLLLDKNITYWEKGISNSFWIIFNKNFACSVNSVTKLWLIWKSSIKIKFLNTKPCPAGLSPRITWLASPFFPKISQNCCTYQVWTVPPSPEPLWETLGMGKNPTQQPKIYSFPPPKNPP